MFYTNGTTTNGINMSVTFVQAALPTCNACKGTPTLRDQAGALWCKPCLDAHIRKSAIANATQWLTAAFLAVSIEQRAKLYKSLASVFHPDVGGDESLMKALNDVRDRTR